MSADLLANVERPRDDRPAPARDREDPSVGYWLGSATGEVQRWRERALRAEAIVAEIRKVVARWKWQP